MLVPVSDELVDEIVDELGTDDAAAIGRALESVWLELENPEQVAEWAEREEVPA